MALRHGFGLCLPGNPGGFAVAVNTGVAGGWTPEAFIEGGAAGDWYIGYDVTNKWVESTGITAVVAGEDPIGKWSPEMGSNPLLQADSNLKPFWDSGQGAVRFPNQPGGGSPYNMAASGLDVTTAEDVTVMATVWAPLTSGTGRQQLGIARFTPDLTYIFVAPNANNATQVFLQPYSVGASNSLSSANTASVRRTISVSRIGGKLQDLYVDGVLEAAGPTADSANGDPLNTILVWGSQGLGQGAMYVKDLIIAYKAADADDHKGYAAYGAAL